MVSSATDATNPAPGGASADGNHGRGGGDRRSPRGQGFRFSSSGAHNSDVVGLIGRAREHAEKKIGRQYLRAEYASTGLECCTTTRSPGAWSTPLAGHGPAAGAGGDRYDVHFSIDAVDAVDVRSGDDEGAPVWRRAVAAARLPPWPIERSELLTAAEQDADLARPQPVLVGVSESPELLGTTRNRAWQGRPVGSGA